MKTNEKLVVNELRNQLVIFIIFLLSC